MKKILYMFVGAWVLLAGPAAQAHQKYSYKSKGNQASFSSWTSDDCSDSGTSVWAFEEQQKGNNQSSYGAVYVDFYSYNYCTGDYEYGYSYFDSTNFSQQKLNSASVSASGTIELYTCNYGGGGDDGGGGMGGMGGTGGAAGSPSQEEDPCTYSSAPVELSISWTGTGDTFKDRSTYSYSSPYSRYRSRFSGQSRDATITGSLIVGGAPVDLSDGWGSLAQTSSGSFEMYR